MVERDVLRQHGDGVIFHADGPDIVRVSDRQQIASPNRSQTDRATIELGDQSTRETIHQQPFYSKKAEPIETMVPTKNRADGPAWILEERSSQRRT
jgi:hypothetical protein